MTGITNNFSISSQSEERSYDLSLKAQHAVGSQESMPKQKDNMSAAAVTSVEHTQTDHSNDVFSHNRYQALSAYKQGTVSNETAEEKIEDSENATASDETSDTKKEKKSVEENDKKTNGEELTDDEQAQVDKLKDRDQEVRTHEQAHLAAAGGLGSGPYYEYENGPDGKRYATGGHVNIDMSKEKTPEKTVSKMQKVIASANAPAEPSGQDRQVAAEARQKMADAKMEIAEEQRQKAESSLHKNKSTDGADETDNAVQNDSAEKDKNISNSPSDSTPKSMGE